MTFPHFPSDAERQRAREAGWNCTLQLVRYPDDPPEEIEKARQLYFDDWDRLYPAQPDAPPPVADFCYEADNWEYTWSPGDFLDALLDLDFDKRVVRVGRLAKLPDQWAARVPVGEPDEEGDYEDYEWTLFATEAEARAAAKEKHDD